MASNYHPKTLIRFICRDFEHAWEALSRVPEKELGARGNFMFARQAMMLLEVACRFSDKAALIALSAALNARDKRYFTVLPGPCGKPRDFNLPTYSHHPERELLAALFDLIRNGQAHQYQPIIANLTDSPRCFCCSLTGVRFQHPLNKTLAHGRPKDHLQAMRYKGDVWIKVRTDVLFLDIRHAVRKAQLFSRGLSFSHLKRGAGSTAPGYYSFSSADLEKQLRLANHFAD
jgi:hypothetical protein